MIYVIPNEIERQKILLRIAQLAYTRNNRIRVSLEKNTIKTLEAAKILALSSNPCMPYQLVNFINDIKEPYIYFEALSKMDKNFNMLSLKKFVEMYSPVYLKQYVISIILLAVAVRTGLITLKSVIQNCDDKDILWDIICFYFYNRLEEWAIFKSTQQDLMKHFETYSLLYKDKIEYDLINIGFYKKFKSLVNKYFVYEDYKTKKKLSELLHYIMEKRKEVQNV